jgi:hypothetical protein
MYIRFAAAITGKINICKKCDMKEKIALYMQEKMKAIYNNYKYEAIYINLISYVKESRIMSEINSAKQGYEYG